MCQAARTPHGTSPVNPPMFLNHLHQLSYQGFEMSARIICYHLRNVTTTTATAFRRTYAIVHHDFPIVSIHPPKPPNPANLCRPLPTNATEVPIRTHRPNVQRSHVTTPSSRARWMMPITTGGLLLVGTLTYLLTTQRPHKTEAPPPSPSSATISSNVGEPGLVPSGTTSVPPFPRILRHPTKGEYVLVGLGIRTVSFLRVQVYVVGFYVHADDEAAVRAAVVRRGGGEAVAEQERSQLRRRLLDPIAGEQVFDEMLGEGIGGWRSLFRVVPTRNTGLWFFFPLSHLLKQRVGHMG
jgi:hypothetical protein